MLEVRKRERLLLRRDRHEDVVQTADDLTVKVFGDLRNRESDSPNRKLFAVYSTKFR